ncbi:hypothetical protein D3C71_1506330 [compost metagenome]
MFILNFNAAETLKEIVNDIEGKLPTDMEEYFDEKINYLTNNGINDRMHVGRTEWTIELVSEWLLSMFMGIAQRGKENELYYNNFGPWLEHVYHFVINNKANLQ